MKQHHRWFALGVLAGGMGVYSAVIAGLSVLTARAEDGCVTIVSGMKDRSDSLAARIARENSERATTSEKSSPNTSGTASFMDGKLFGWDA